MPLSPGTRTTHSAEAARAENNVATCWAVLAGIALLTGCASTGPPRPPSLHLPQPVRDLAAQRTGDHVDLSFTVPTLSTDRQPLAGRHGAGRLTAILCRADAPSQPCAPVHTASVTPGELVHEHDRLPAALTRGEPRPLRYTVRLLNAQGRSSADAREAVAVAGAAPAAVLHLAAATTAHGIQLTWQPEPTPSQAPATQVRIAADSAGAGRNLTVPGDPGGMVDPNPRVGDTVTYTVVRSLQLPGDPAATLRGEAAVVTVRRLPDTFAPAPPAGLVSIAVQLGQAPPEIDLSWEPNTEPDLAGYLVERADDQGTAPPLLLTPAPIPATSFRDLAVEPGHTYRYTVRAQDRAGNRSPRSAPAVETLRR